jgi:hypothetical protein
MLPSSSFVVVIRLGASRGDENGKAGDSGGHCLPPRLSLPDHVVTHCCLLCKRHNARTGKKAVCRL